MFLTTASGPLTAPRIRTSHCILHGALLLILALAAVAARAEAPLSVPAEYEFTLTPPGEGNGFLRPSSLRLDRAHGELLVADPGNSRIVLFDARGVYRFEFGGGDGFAVPLDVAVDADGVYHVLGSNQAGLGIHRYDFDGRYLGALPRPEGAFEPRSLVYADGAFYVADAATASIRVFDDAGVELRAWTLHDESVGEEPAMFGRLEHHDGRLLLPMSLSGAVVEYDLDGDRLRTIGRKGQNAGELNFPVAVQVTADGAYLILDKHRFTVVCYDAAGAFVGEFGGKGSREGWFYHPSLLLDLADGRVVVGQLYRNLVQVCRIPADFADAFRSGHGEDF